jgi:archaellin
MKVVEKGSVKVSTSATKQTIIKKANDALIAEFTVKPSNGASSVDLEEISFTLTPNTLTPRDITVKVGDIEEDDTPSNSFDYSMNKEVTSEGVVVRITLDDEDNAK